MTVHFVSKSAGSPCSMCGKRSTHKIGEEIPWDEPCSLCGTTWRQRGVTGKPHDANDCIATYHIMGGPTAQRHNLTAYVCCDHFTLLLGPATGCPVSTFQSAKAHGKEWLLLEQHASAHGVSGYTAIEIMDNGRAKMPAVVHYIEVKHGNVEG